MSDSKTHIDRALQKLRSEPNPSGNIKAAIADLEAAAGASPGSTDAGHGTTLGSESEEGSPGPIGSLEKE